MIKKLAGYLGLSFGSFCICFAILHGVASAQTPQQQVVLLTPTPTIFFTVMAPPQSYFPTNVTTTPIAEKNGQPSTPITIEQAKNTTITQPQQTTATPLPTLAPTATPTTIPTAIPTAIPQPAIAAPAELEPLFNKYSHEYNVDANLLKRIARCEAGFNSQSDTGTYAGMFQFAAGTWISKRTQMGLDSNQDLRKNAEESIRTAAFMIANGQQAAWPNCQ